MPSSLVPLETAAPLMGSLVTGHFIETSGYQTWRGNGTGDYLLMLTLSGSGRIGWDGGEYHTSAGDLILLMPRTRHDYGTTPGLEWEFLWTHFLPHPHWLPLLDWPALAPGVGCLRASPNEAAGQSIAIALHAMHACATSGLARREAWGMNRLENALLCCDPINPARPDAIADARIADVVRHLRQHLTEPFYLPRLADRIGLSASRLSHLFRQHTGQTPRQFLERERLSRAAQLLKFTARPVGQIALDVGFDNPFYFSLRFKAETGLAPRDFRRRFGGQA